MYLYVYTDLKMYLNFDQLFAAGLRGLGPRGRSVERVLAPLWTCEAADRRLAA